MSSDYVIEPIEESDSKNEWIIRFTGQMGFAGAGPLIREIGDRIREERPERVTADLEGVRYFDDYGALVLYELGKVVDQTEGSWSVTGADEEIQGFLSGADFTQDNTCTFARKKRSTNMFIRIGDATLKELKNLQFMVSFIGSILLSLVYVIRHPKSLRVSDTINHMERTGVDALPVVAMIGFLMGLIMAFMSSIQLSQFGAEIYVASLVAFAMVSELGPIMTAVVVSGRSGSAYAAEIGTMKISEEVDALYIMGFDPTIFLAVPRIIAAMIMVPMLTLFSNLFAIGGGLLVGVFMLDLSLNTYINQSLYALTIKEVIWGMFKSSVFAALIASIGCLRGFQARGGASAVGTAATSAVVTSIFMIVLFDSIFAVFRSYW